MSTSLSIRRNLFFNLFNSTILLLGKHDSLSQDQLFNFVANKFRIFNGSESGYSQYLKKLASRGIIEYHNQNFGYKITLTERGEGIVDAILNYGFGDEGQNE